MALDLSDISRDIVIQQVLNEIFEREPHRAWDYLYMALKSEGSLKSRKESLVLGEFAKIANEIGVPETEVLAICVEVLAEVIKSQRVC